MLTAKAKAMMLLNEAVRVDRRAEALEILRGFDEDTAVTDWAGMHHALQHLVQSPGKRDLGRAEQ